MTSRPADGRIHKRTKKRAGAAPAVRRDRRGRGSFMKSVKPGRGPSAMGALGSLIGVIFGVIWTGAAASMGAPPFFLAFGGLFIVVGVVQALYHYKNATGKNRFSSFDITEDGEEPDPLDPLSREDPGQDWERGPSGGEARFCPYCGARSGGGFVYCAKCGKRLPEIE